jgi:hypothetical protein
MSGFRDRGHLRVPRFPFRIRHYVLGSGFEVGQGIKSIFENNCVELADEVRQQPRRLCCESQPFRQRQAFLPEGHCVARFSKLHLEYISNNNHDSPPFKKSIPIMNRWILFVFDMLRPGIEHYRDR